ncbi:malonate decarboxylase holo-ACP synthase [Anaeromyxobacter diazotrophicus]|uniref:malonate decarboxylase holo-ACP synthase n=1 Tax=Anaeromyxobacter diazotrophicus TaxID=2590199 RepID=UPI001591F9FE|nr:malonate decarboxylase holo-ACP synthase [Anaeromyxobacter diazotrophicus]
MPAPCPAGAPRPHDLLALAGPEALALDGPLPEWARESLSRAPWVVARRAAPERGRWPVGVRGARREERLAAWVAEASVLRRLSPEDLAAARGWRAPARRRWPFTPALELAEEALARAGLAWGPAGSVGFELATGAAAAGAASDLDLVVRAPAPLPRELARELWGRLAASPVRIDAQVETPAGAFALAEYAADTAAVALRTAAGPRRVADPWREGSAR